jgi:uncharacterized protein YajQ (UPF0234 family)
MPSDSSFDIVSDYDRQELVNAVDQTHREMQQRYDLKSAGGTLELEKDAIVIAAPSDMTLRAIIDVLESKMVRRSLDLKILSLGPVEAATGSSVRQRITLKKGIEQDLAREIVKVIRDAAPKVKAQIQGDSVRVTGKSRDELQRAITAVKDRNFDAPLEFQNYR